MKVRYTSPALADLDDVLTYITERSPQGASRVKAGIAAAERLLSQFPFAGVAQTRHPWLRRLTVGPFPYVILYEVTDEIIIHTVRHAARNPETRRDRE